MKCTIDNKYLPMLRQLAEQTGPGARSSEAGDMHAILRVSAADRSVTLAIGSDEATVASEVERPGVLFVPAAPFFSATEHLHTRHRINIEASADGVRVNDRTLDIRKKDFKVYADVARAPKGWTGAASR